MLEEEIYDVKCQGGWSCLVTACKWLDSRFMEQFSSGYLEEACYQAAELIFLSFSCRSYI